MLSERLERSEQLETYMKKVNSYRNSYRDVVTHQQAERVKAQAVMESVAEELE